MDEDYRLTTKVDYLPPCHTKRIYESLVASEPNSNSDAAKKVTKVWIPSKEMACRRKIRSWNIGISAWPSQPASKIMDVADVRMHIRHYLCWVVVVVAVFMVRDLERATVELEDDAEADYDINRVLQMRKFAPVRPRKSKRRCTILRRTTHTPAHDVPSSTEQDTFWTCKEGPGDDDDGVDASSSTAGQQPPEAQDYGKVTQGLVVFSETDEFWEEGDEFEEENDEFAEESDEFKESDEFGASGSLVYETIRGMDGEHKNDSRLILYVGGVAAAATIFVFQTIIVLPGVFHTDVGLVVMVDGRPGVLSRKVIPPADVTDARKLKKTVVGKTKAVAKEISSGFFLWKGD
ncbi:hypothetical protein Dda_6253 [Drechslerella dactyloides]|uniref:Uncharacterized protein n=1 Tax=Drechslerella dactyloides TaxID=74499 RepID=A0AAD6IV84_DREDA|nr:hypothetical protein Dda_6253 [Drechslerella dactyloides]